MQVKKLERELRLATSTGAAAGTEAAAAPAEGTAASASAALHEVAIMQQELDEVRQLKKQREEALLACKKQLAEAQYELTKAQVSAAPLLAEFALLFTVHIGCNASNVDVSTGVSTMHNIKIVVVDNSIVIVLNVILYVRRRLRRTASATPIHPHS